MPADVDGADVAELRLVACLALEPRAAAQAPERGLDARLPERVREQRGLVVGVVELDQRRRGARQPEVPDYALAKAGEEPLEPAAVEDPAVHEDRPRVPER